VRLDKLYTHGFRNLSPAEITCGARFNLFCGANGQGKTNILEAIYLLGTLKSFRHARNRDLIRFSEVRALLKGSVHSDTISSDIAVELDLRVKHPRIDGKAVDRVGEFFGHLNLVLFTPDDLLMLKGQPELRRKFIDRAVFSVDLSYLRWYHVYTRALKNRNALLKSGDIRSLDVWSEQLVAAGAVLAKRRADFVAVMAPMVQRFYRELSGKNEDVTIQYLSLMADANGQVNQDAAEIFYDGLGKSAKEEIKRGSTLCGPHRDDLLFEFNGRDVRQYASQGQLRSLILAVKMAEIEITEEKFGTAPILLLDDLASELDRQRTANMLAFLRNKTIQVFIATTDAAAIPFTDSSDVTLFHVEAGSIFN
jgi:DNA replication and repair protein RecF